jgi:hypothetical protein
MTLITLQDGKLVLRDGKVGTEQECCCKKCESDEDCPEGECCVDGECGPCEEECSGPCDGNEDCEPGCECVDGECVALGTCCEQGCVTCTGANYRWDGEKWALTSCFPEGCPTTECEVTDCPAVADEDPPSQEAIDFAAANGLTLNLFIRWCCPFPDSQYTCFQSTQAQCTEVFQEWTKGEGCGADPQTYCDGKFNPLP